MEDEYNIDPQVILSNLVELLTNTVNMTSKFYDIFLNPTPMDVELEQYNDENELITVIIPNRAKDRILTKFGEGSPEGVVVAVMGTMYIDIANSEVYIKVSGDDEYGWIPVSSEENIIPIIRKYLIDNGYVNVDYLVEHGYVTRNDHASTTVYGVVKYDGYTIVENSDGQLNVAGLADQNRQLKKLWVGLKSNYDSILNKDSATFYVITDD